MASAVRALESRLSLPGLTLVVLAGACVSIAVPTFDRGRVLLFLEQRYERAPTPENARLIEEHRSLRDARERALALTFLPTAAVLATLGGWTLHRRWRSTAPAMAGLEA